MYGILIYPQWMEFPPQKKTATDYPQLVWITPYPDKSTHIASIVTPSLAVTMISDLATQKLTLHYYIIYLRQVATMFHNLACALNGQRFRFRIRLHAITTQTTKVVNPMKTDSAHLASYHRVILHAKRKITQRDLWWSYSLYSVI